MLCFRHQIGTEQRQIEIDGRCALFGMIVERGRRSTICSACLWSQIAMKEVDPDRGGVARNTEGISHDRPSQDCR